MMNVESLINEGLIILDLDDQIQSDVFNSLSTLLLNQDRINNKDDFIKSLKARDEEFSTGFGNGFAIPHCKSDTVKSASIAIAKLKNGVEWKAMDDLPVYFVIMLAIPENESSNTHLKILAALSEKLMDDDFREDLINVENPKHIIDVLSEAINKKNIEEGRE